MKIDTVTLKKQVILHLPYLLFLLVFAKLGQAVPLAMLQTLNRSLHRAYNRIRENNFSINGLIGFDLRGKTFGIVGTGKIGRVFAELLQGFGVRLLAYDVFPNRKSC